MQHTVHQRPQNASLHTKRYTKKGAVYREEVGRGGQLRVIEVYDVKGMAKVLNIGIRKAYTLVETGEIKSTRIGRSIRVKEEWIQAYLERETAAVTGISTKPTRQKA